MRRFLRYLALTTMVAGAMLAFSAAANASLTVNYVFNGSGGYSSDGLGQNGTGGTVQAEVPAGSTVQKAFLYGTYFFNADPDVTQRTIDFDGTMVETTKISGPIGCCDLVTTRADVTAQVAAKVGSGGGITDFAINNDPTSLDGVALVVVYSNPTLPENTIALLDGSASPAGDTATFILASPLDKTVPGFTATMALGSGFSFQGAAGHVCGTTQFSTVEVNSQLLTNCAGNYDDGAGNNGALITVGGVGDSFDNPTPPNAPLTDDELYNLEPFLSQGDTSIEVKTTNSSNDDNLFLAVIAITARATVTNEDCNNGIDDDGDGLIDSADPDCAPPPSGNTCGTISGAGIAQRNRMHFYVRYRQAAPAPEGSVVLNDTTTPMRFDSTSITTLVINGDDAVATGNGIANGVPVTFTLTIHNNPDTMTLELSNGYKASWTNKGGGRTDIAPC
jgi:hypothetical protein